MADKHLRRPDVEALTGLGRSTIYDLMVTPGKIKGTDTMALCRILNIDTAEFNKRIINAIIKNKSYRVLAD